MGLGLFYYRLSDSEKNSLRTGAASVLECRTCLAGFGAPGAMGEAGFSRFVGGGDDGAAILCSSGISIVCAFEIIDSNLILSRAAAWLGKKASSLESRSLPLQDTMSSLSSEFLCVVASWQPLRRKDLAACREWSRRAGKVNRHSAPDPQFGA